MPNGPVLKLCEACDQISFTRSGSRDQRCYRPVPPQGKPCRSRRVIQLTIGDLNGRLLLERAVVVELRTELANVRSRLAELEEIVEDLRERRR